jgi:trehalose-phosphatase
VRSGSTLLAFDFDGTLAPICENPSKVQMSRGAALMLREATRMRGVAVAVASGRDAEDIATRIGLPGAYIIGSHGLEIRAPGGVLIRDSPPLGIDFDERLRGEIERSGLRVERKKHGIALHWRGLDSEQMPGLLHGFRSWARSARLDVIEGRCVAEARCHGGGKEEALRWLASAIGAARVMYAGDDLTDFGALRFAAERGLGVFVANSDVVAPPGVTVVESFRELLRLVREEVVM